MNYDRIIIEILNRVKILEEQLVEVKGELQLKNEDFEEEVIDENEEGKYTRSQAREKAIQSLQKKHPDYQITKASRKEGSGIKIIKPRSKRSIIVKFYHSKSFECRSGDEHGWHVVRLNDVVGTRIDFCIFSMIDLNGNWNFLIYQPDELDEYYKENRSSDNDILHLYFVVKDNKAMEVREDTVDVTNHLNNWDMIR